MRLFLDYFKLIDLLALAALAALACAALVRDGSVWLFLAGILVAIWGCAARHRLAMKLARRTHAASAGYSARRLCGGSGSA